MAVSTERYRALRQRLETEREQLTVEIEEHRRAMRDLAVDLSEENGSYGNHMADDASDTYDQERQAVEQRNLETVLEQVNDALGRMEDGAYGRCVDCGREIPVERLEARPYALRCIEDQTKEDRRR